MKIVFTPDWFLTADILIEVFSFIILTVFFILSEKSYKITKKKNTFYLGVGFLLIAIAELATILTKFVLYYDTTVTQNIGVMAVSYHVLKSVDIFYYMGFFLHRILTLLGLYLIYRIPFNEKSGRDVILTIFFLIVSVIFSNTAYYIFHLTAFIILLLILDKYRNVYHENKNKNTKLLLNAFVLLTTSQVVFLLSTVQLLYVFAQIIQLISYLMLLVLAIRLFKYGKQENSK